MGVVCDVIFSLIAGLPEVYPNFFGVSDGVLQQYEKKFSGPAMHTGTPSGPPLYILTRKRRYQLCSSKTVYSIKKNHYLSIRFHVFHVY